MSVLRLVLAAVLGVLAVYAFAPWGYWPLALVGALGLLALLSYGGAGRAFILAWAYGAAFFSFGLHWLYISINVNSPQPAPAWLSILIVAGLTIPLGLLFAIPASVAVRIARQWSLTGRLLLLVALLTAFEWLRSWLLTGFPWLSLGFSQIDSPLAGYAPVGGVHLITLLTWLTAALLLLLCFGRWRVRVISLSFAAAIWVFGFVLLDIEWSQPSGSDGQDISVALVQGNIPQREKWQRGGLRRAVQKYNALSLPHMDKVDVVIWPEAAVPGFFNGAGKMRPSVPQATLDQWQQLAATSNTDILIGAIWWADEPMEAGQAERRNIASYNSLVQVPDSVGGDVQVYHKRHLVPFGEYSPLPDSLTEVVRNMGLPAPNTLAGQVQQDLLVVDGVPLGISICYEDVFARDVLNDLPSAEVLVNVSNDSWFAINQTASTDWFGDGWFNQQLNAWIDDFYRHSPGPHQHHEMARMRAAETRRYMLRSTNTGISGFIDPFGYALSSSEQFVDTVLTGTVTARRGLTPFIFLGHWLAVGGCVLLLLTAVFVRRKPEPTGHAAVGGSALSP